MSDVPVIVTAAMMASLCVVPMAKSTRTSVRWKCLLAETAHRLNRCLSATAHRVSCQKIFIAQKLDQQFSMFQSSKSREPSRPEISILEIRDIQNGHCWWGSKKPLAQTRQFRQPCFLRLAQLGVLGSMHRVSLWVTLVKIKFLKPPSLTHFPSAQIYQGIYPSCHNLALRVQPSVLENKQSHTTDNLFYPIPL